MVEMFSSAGNALAGDGAQSIYWAFAIAGTAIFAVSMVLQILGVGDCGLPEDVDVDLDGDIDIPHPDTGFPDLQIFSFRTIMAFITMFGWGGVVFGIHGWLGFLAAFLCGTAMMFLTAWLIALLMKLRQSGNVYPKDIVGKQGTVYLTIPSGKSRNGKVSINLGDATKEIKAVAEDKIPTGTEVKVTDYLGGDVYLVTRV